MRRLIALTLLFPLLTSCASLWGSKKEKKRAPQPPPVEEVKKPSPKEKAEGYYQIGVAYLQMGEIPLALNYLMKAKKLNPEDPKIYNAIGLAFIRRGDYGRAEEYLKKALSLKPDFSEAWLNLGILNEERGNLKKAKECYLKALENPLYLTPEAAYYRLALIELKEGSREQAKRYLIMAIRNNRDFAPAYIELAKLLEEDGKVGQAKDIYFRLIYLYPNLQEPYCRLGELFLSEGDTLNGVKYLRKCIQIKPTSELAAKARRRLEEIERQAP
ncbi:tetratricopeptide repeat protein [Thermovibrio sp.]